MDQAKRGADALNNGQYAKAIEEYTAAIKVSPTSPDYHIKRSMAYQRSSPADYTNALADAEDAVRFAQQRAKRELTVQAQLRRAIALFGLERWADAKFVLDIVKRMDPKEKTLAIWENKISSKLDSIGEDDAQREVTVKETPGKAASTSTNSTTAPSQPSPASKDAPANVTAASVQTPANKIRHDWYQSSDNVTFTLLVKGAPKDEAIVDIQEDSLNMSFPLVTDSIYEFSLDPLYAPVDVSASRYTVMPSKIEVILKKKQPGQKWHSLEQSDSTASGNAVTSLSTDKQGSTAQTNSTTTSAGAQSTSTAAKGPAYPTSSRSGPKNWDKLAQELTTKEKSDDAKGDGLNDDDLDDGEGGDEVNKFFQKLYAGADPDTRRAMMKSFSESNGTALSTNWEDVKKKKMETTPPDGMEARKW
ncbi:hypothetical protein AAFC00_000606 [Neodothiora populina]|uniref:SGS-domain-containing protein n=1 Tax=Neodothiora populina TaxID=2781224 RepID=A0ABR3PDF2_9PEZI